KRNFDLLVTEVEVVGDHHPEGRQDALADVLLGDLGVGGSVRTELDQQVVDRVLLAQDEDVREVLGVRKLIGLRRPGVSCTVTEPEAGGNGQGRPCYQKSLEDCSTLNGSVKS